ncbi:MAG: hypothetical protein WBA74_20520 [Cyclobacteriaceae bacterium]
MSLVKKILVGFLIFLVLVSIVIALVTVCFSNIQNHTIKTYELSDVEMKLLSDRIGTLDSIEKRKNFLENLFSTDQKVRINEANTIDKYGYNTPEHLRALSSMDSVDTYHLYLIKQYLDIYGFPSKHDYHDIATLTPLMVFHHKSDFEEFKNYFHYFYSAYRGGDISADRLSLILNRKYMFKFDKNFNEEEKPFSNEAKIEKLIKVLDLSECK